MVSVFILLSILHISAGRCCCSKICKSVICPPKLRKGLFSLSVMDSIDYNPASTMVAMSFHETSMLFMQPSNRCLLIKACDMFQSAFLLPSKTQVWKCCRLNFSHLESQNGKSQKYGCFSSNNVISNISQLLVKAGLFSLIRMHS